MLFASAAATEQKKADDNEGVSVPEGNKCSKNPKLEDIGVANEDERPIEKAAVKSNAEPEDTLAHNEPAKEITKNCRWDECATVKINFWYSGVKLQPCGEKHWGVRFQDHLGQSDRQDVVDK